MEQENAGGEQMLYDDEGRRIDLLWLRDNNLEAVTARLGEPYDEPDWELTAGLKITPRAWWLWGGGVVLRRAEAAGPFALPIVTADAPHLLFNLDFALDMAGLDSDDLPPNPVCTPDGTVKWLNWPDVGIVVINYALRTIGLYKLNPTDGGTEEDDLAGVIDLATWRRAA